jgi:hypothetical protein
LTGYIARAKLRITKLLKQKTMKKQKPPLFRIGLSIAVLVSSLLLQAFQPSTASAAQITTRRLTLQAGATDGGSKPGGVVNHFFEFTVPTTGTAIGSIKFEYCTLAAGACTVPTGLVTTSATLGTETGATGFSVNNSTNGAPFLFKATAATPATGNLTYQLQSITNPSTTNYTFFVRITTFNGTDGVTSPIDNGTVTAATATPIVITGTMPESLVFCTGATVSKDIATNTVPDCSTATPGAISFDRLFSPTDTAVTSSQMAASTNAGAGYAITVNGATMTSGTNTISGMSASTAGVRGTSQFGMNLKANTTTTSTPAMGTEVAPVPNASNYRGQAATGYDSVDTFKFATGDTVANSYNGAPGGTDAQIFTVSYIVNVPGSQPAGTYTTTLTYICTPTF